MVDVTVGASCSSGGEAQPLDSATADMTVTLNATAEGDGIRMRVTATTVARRLPKQCPLTLLLICLGVGTLRCDNFGARSDESV